MKKKKNRSYSFLLLIGMLVFLWSCSDKNDNSKQVPHDPTKPVTITEFMPDGGRLREKVIIKGNNFGNDKSKVSVFFVTNDGIEPRRATVVGVDNNTIYCLAPRQTPGDNKIRIVVDEKEADATETFHYEAAENVSTIAGTETRRETKDGNLGDASFQYIFGIAALGGDQAIVCQRDDPCVRYISVPDNEVITIHPGFKGGSPAITKDRKTVYIIGHDLPHTIYQYKEENGWSPSRIGQLGTDPFSRTIRGVAIGKEEEYLYFIESTGKFGRYNLNTRSAELLAEVWEGAGNSENSYMAYSEYEDCFYVTCAMRYSIYRITMQGNKAVAEDYCGSANARAIQDGYLQDARFAQPNGLTVDEDGNIYVTEGDKGHVIRKISTRDGYVSTIAGANDKAGQVDGDPIDARFNYPYDIASDGDGGYWIAESWGQAVRKYAIE